MWVNDEIVICSKLDGQKYREKYIELFIDTQCEYYKNQIATLQRYSDWNCYNGYLWDCFKFRYENNPADYNYVIQRIKMRNQVMFFWDIHSSESQHIPSFAQGLPKDAVIKMKGSRLVDRFLYFPADIYIFDDEFKWTILLTHEADLNNNNWCYMWGET